jgi:SGNH domain (fused to AT3 domains)
MSSCAPILDFKVVPLPHCWAFNEKVFDWISTNHTDKVVLSALWPVDRPEYLLKIYDTIDRLAGMGVMVILIGNTPRYAEPVPHILAKRLMRGDTDRHDDGKDLSGDATDRLVGAHYAESRTVLYISPKRTLCNNSRCPLALENGAPIQFDRDHFTGEGSTWAVRRMFENHSIVQKMFGPAVAQAKNRAK